VAHNYKTIMAIDGDLMKRRSKIGNSSLLVLVLQISQAAGNNAVECNSVKTGRKGRDKW
jgi:hypothetical protein